MYNSSFAESTTNTAHFPEADVQSFDILVEWVYLGTVHAPTEGREWDCISAYALAEKLLLSDLQDRIMDARIRHERDANILSSEKDIPRAYMHAGYRAGSGLRSYAVESLRYILDAAGSKEKWATAELQPLFVIADLAADFIDSVRGAQESRDPTKRSMCDFHCHGEGEKCRSRGKVRSDRK